MDTRFVPVRSVFLICWGIITYPFCFLSNSPWKIAAAATVILIWGAIDGFVQAKRRTKLWWYRMILFGIPEDDLIPAGKFILYAMQEYKINGGKTFDPDKLPELIGLRVAELQKMGYILIIQSPNSETKYFQQTPSARDLLTYIDSIL